MVYIFINIDGDYWCFFRNMLLLIFFFGKMRMVSVMCYKIFWWFNFKLEMFLIF